MSRFHAARVAASIRRELDVEVDEIHGRYGEYRVLVDGRVVVDAGARAALGWMPSTRRVVEQVRHSLGAPADGG